MSAISRFAWRSAWHNRGRSLLLAACIALTFLLPLGVERLVRVYGAELRARAVATPLVVGAPGSRFDLVLGALYFRGRPARPTSMAELERLAEGGLGAPIPLVAGATAQGVTVVGTSLDYFDFRALAVAEGAAPAWLGEALLGAGAARRLGLGVGDALLADRGSLYDLTVGYPLRMRVVGVLAPAGTADDDVAFVDVKTAWILDGLGHGHQDAEAAAEETLLGRGADAIVFNAAVREYTEITPENEDGFHFHAAPEELPLSAILVVPRAAKDATLLKARYGVRDDAELVVPVDVVEEILGFVFRLKAFFDANVMLVSLATALFLVLFVLLLVRVRRREVETLFKIGCSRATVVGLFAAEMALVVGAGLALALAAAWTLVQLVGRGYLFS